MKKTAKKGQKILIQIGVIIVVLFSAVTLAVGNMITMSSFSTALNSNMSLFTYYLSLLSDSMNEYQSLTWLMDYWKDNADTLVKENIRSHSMDDLDRIVKSFSKESAEEVTEEEVKTLSPEDQKAFAIGCYNEIQDIFEMYQTTDENDEEELAIILAMTEKDGEEPFVIFTNYSEDNILLGTTADIQEVKKVIDNTTDATKAEVWKWAFSTPGKMMLFGTNLPFEYYKGTSASAEMLGIFSAELVYGDMSFTTNIRNQVIVMMLVVLALILIALYFIVPRPLSIVHECVSEYSNTKDVHALTEKLSAIHSKNEIGAFADEFSSLALEMERYTREMEVLAGERERVATELNVATNIQMQMLPHIFPEKEEFSLFASMNPAKEVGGDFYDCYMIDDDHLAMTIADVSGKGVPAALFMAVSKTMLKNRTIVGGTPSTILQDVNNWLFDGNDSCMFVTVWLGILTVSTGELICANAGHEYPGIRSGGEAFHLIRTSHGMPLGLVEDREYTDEHYTLSPGDAFFVYTDGVPEANSPNEEMFGEDRLESVLSSASKDDSPKDILEKVRTAVDEFAAGTPQYDDLTMLCLVKH